MRNFVIFTALAVAIAAPAAAQPATQSSRPNEIIYANVAGPAEIPDAPNGDNTIVCNYERNTGTLFVDRVCRTLRAWKLMQSDAYEYKEFNHLGTHQVDDGG